MNKLSIVLQSILFCWVLNVISVAVAQDNIDVNTSAQSASLIIEQMTVENPLLDDTVRGGYALVSSQAYKSSYHLYPVLIETINKFPIKHLLHGYQYKLLPGTYVIELKPNFSVLKDIKPFMNDSFASKRIEINVEGNKEYAIGARINPDAPEQWQVQFFDIKQRITNDSQP